jgi:hypothetical protein
MNGPHQTTLFLLAYEEAGALAHADGVAKFFEGFSFDLADALAGEVEELRTLRRPDATRARQHTSARKKRGKNKRRY